MAEKGILQVYERQYGAVGIGAHGMALMLGTYATGKAISPDMTWYDMVVPGIALCAAVVGGVYNHFKKKEPFLDNLVSAVIYGAGTFTGLELAGKISDRIVENASLEGVVVTGVVGMTALYGANEIVRRKKPVKNALLRSAAFACLMYVTTHIHSLERKVDPKHVSLTTEVVYGISDDGARRTSSRGNDHGEKDGTPYAPIVAGGLSAVIFGATEIQKARHCMKRVS